MSRIVLTVLFGENEFPFVDVNLLRRRESILLIKGLEREEELSNHLPNVSVLFGNFVFEYSSFAESPNRSCDRILGNVDQIA